MLPGYPNPLWSVTVLYLLLLADLDPVLTVHVVSVPAGETVNIRCLEENVTHYISLIEWKKQNLSHVLRFVFFNGSKKSVLENFTNTRFSFLESELPLTLQIRNVQVQDSGNYNCTVIGKQGNNLTMWKLQVSDARSLGSPTSGLIGLSGLLVVLVILIGIIYWKMLYGKHGPQRQIHQACQEPTEHTEAVYNNIEESYFVQFNTMYEGIPANQVR